MYLEELAVLLVLNEGADFVQVGAGSNVLHVRTVLHILKFPALVLTQDCWATVLGQFISLSVKEWA